MANWAIAIGVNQYEFLHPLKYAKNDALHICQFLGNEAKFDRIFYFSDDSPDLDGKTTKPFRNNLLKVFKELFAQPFLHESDNFWFFFAGHGILSDGIDYLMPSDGDPDNVADTGISVNQVIQNLRGSGAGNVILALDACRNQVRRNGGSRSGEGIGRETEREAKIADVISIAACSPSEYSYEVDDLQHGAFTYALVEGLGLQGRCATAAKLNTYLKHRVPELAKTRQTPRMMLDPQEKGHLILMPKYAEKIDLEPLKKDAFKAHRNKNLDLARRLWMQVLAVDGTDYEAIAEIEGLAVERYLGRSPQVAPNPAVATQRRDVSKPPEPNPLTIDLGNGVMLELVRVPAGKFMMGSPDGKGDADERPQHQVTLTEFLIGKYAVTNAQWQAVMKTKGSANCDQKFQGDLQPVVGVSWHEARAFCAKVSQQSGRAVRLPTEAEWEYASRGANQSKGYEYAGNNNLDEVAWYSSNSGKVTHPVGQKKANELGIYDMSGNVWEWCLDEWHDSYKDKPDRIKSNGNEAWGDLNVDDNDNRSHLLRGGSWCSNARNCRSAYRFRSGARFQDNRIGFRVLLASSS
jgi:formylglycine-generating enzyme required for sulfatase activity